MTTMVIIGIVCGLVLVIMIGDIVFSEPVEDFDKDAEDSKIDTIRDELEQQVTPQRPHVRAITEPKNEVPSMQSTC